MPDNSWDARRLRIATQAAGVGLWAWNVDTDRIVLDDQACDLWGVSPHYETTFEQLSSRIHPADLDKVRAAFNATREKVGLYETDFRIMVGDEVRWVSSRGEGDEEGIRDRVMYGVFLDVTVRKRAEEAREMVAGEMHHRIKNLFSIARALLSFSSRATETKEELVLDLSKRLTALADAHGLIHPTLSEQRAAAPLNDLLTVLLAAYAEDGTDHGRIHVNVPDLLVGEHSTTTMALIFHELATNSAKYGALGASRGKVAISCVDTADTFDLIWTETGGPPPTSERGQTGYGGSLIARASVQMGGSITYEWPPSGAIIMLHLNKLRVGA